MENACGLLPGEGSYKYRFALTVQRASVVCSAVSGYEIKKHLKPLLWLFALVVSMELYTVLDSTMLGFIQGDAAVGRYTAAVKVNRDLRKFCVNDTKRQYETTRLSQEWKQEIHDKRSRDYAASTTGFVERVRPKPTLQ